MRTIRIAIMEPRVDVFESLQARYEPVVLLVGYQAEFIHCESEKALRRLLRSQIVHVVICDLAVNNDFVGLYTVKYVKTDYPDILCIGNTSGDLLYQQSVYPTFDIFVDKGRLFGEHQTYKEQLAEQIRVHFRMNVSVSIDPASDLTGCKRFKAHQDRDLLSIISQITFTTHDDDLATGIRTVKLTPLTGGRSNSDVFKVTAHPQSEAFSCVPAVLKISEENDARLELSNYHRCVKWLLPYTWRVDVLGIGFTKAFGGICYSFVLSGNKPFDSLTYYISQGRNDIIDKLTETVLSPDMKRWYGLVQKERNINQRYINRFYPSRTATNKSLQQFEYLIQAETSGIVRNHEISVFDSIYPKPHEALLGKPYGDYTSCICHGDLNSNNIVITTTGECIFIDFQYTGRGHVFEDFIMLEISIRLHYPEDATSLADEIDKEKNMSAGNEHQGGTIRAQVAKVRKVARRNFPDEPFANYYYGLASVAFAMMRYDSIERRRKMRLVPCILASLDLLVR